MTDTNWCRFDFVPVSCKQGLKFSISNRLGPVAQSLISANPELNINTLIWFMYFYMAVCFKTLDKKTSVEPEKISRIQLYVQRFNFMYKQLKILT